MTMVCNCISKKKHKISVHNLEKNTHRVVVGLFFNCIGDIIYYSPWLISDIPELAFFLQNLDPLGKYRIQLDEVLQCKESNLYRQRWETENKHMKDCRPSTTCTYKKIISDILSEIETLDQQEEWIRPQLESINDNELPIEIVLQTEITDVVDSLEKLREKLNIYADVESKDVNIIRNKLRPLLHQGLQKGMITSTVVHNTLKTTYINSVFSSSTQMNNKVEMAFWKIIDTVLSVS